MAVRPCTTTRSGFAGTQHDAAEIPGEDRPARETLSNGWTRLSSYLLDYIDRKGATQRLKREIYHRTPRACILLYDPKRDLVVLVRQFRLAVHLNGDPGLDDRGAGRPSRR